MIYPKPAHRFESLNVRQDAMSPVCPDYRERPFHFTGWIERVEIHLGEAAERASEELVERHLRDY